MQVSHYRSSSASRLRRRLRPHVLRVDVEGHDFEVQPIPSLPLSLRAARASSPPCNRLHRHPTGPLFMNIHQVLKGFFQVTHTSCPPLLLATYLPLNVPFPLHILRLLQLRSAAIAIAVGMAGALAPGGAALDHPLRGQGGGRVAQGNSTGTARPALPCPAENPLLITLTTHTALPRPAPPRRTPRPASLAVTVLSTLHSTLTPSLPTHSHPTSQ